MKVEPLSHPFRGGVSLDEHKAHRAAPSRRAPLPNELRLPLARAEATTQVGEWVARGTCLSAGESPTHAPTSGRIVSVGADHTVLAVDHEHAALPPLPRLPTSASADAIVERIRACGVAGLGGGGFPTATKLRAARDAGVGTLIVNAVECEPWVTADEVLLREHRCEIASGIGIAMSACGAGRAVLVVDPRNSALGALDDDPSLAFETYAAALRYPAGSERQLIEQFVGTPLAAGARPPSVGILVLNVATIYAIHRAVVAGEPLTERLVALTGDALEAPGTAWVPIGTPVDELIDWWQPQARSARMLRGGPLTGIELEPHAAVDKRTYAVSFVTESPAPVPCIRCGHCNEVCPERLSVDALHLACAASDDAALERLHIDSCIACGACEVVCPSRLPLLAELRAAQATHVARDRAARAADRARRRYARHLERATTMAERERNARLRRRTATRSWLDVE